MWRKKMIKKIYTIKGFDCPNCAAKAEGHLSKHEKINYCHLDFSGNKMYLTFKDEEMSIEEIKKVINEVESNKIYLEYYTNEKPTNESKILTKPMWFILIRVFFAIVMMVICMFFLAEDTPLFNYLRFGIYTLTTSVLLYDIFIKVILHIKHKENILDHNLLITISSVGALALGLISLFNHHNPISYLGKIKFAHDDAMEALMVVLLFQIGHIIELIAVNKSKHAIMKAVELRVDTANLIVEEGIKKVKPEDLIVNDVILITSGELIAVDGEVIEGEAYVDTSSLTGEYVPVKASTGDKVFGGCLIRNGTIKVKVNKKYEDSTVAKIIDLISSGGEKKSKADEFIAKFAKIYTPIVVIVAIMVFLVGGLITQNQWLTFVSVGLKIIVTGCPCAIVISVPLAYFAAIGLSSKNGIVIKGANYLDSLVNLGKLLTDKTGTLTKGEFTITKVNNIKLSESEFLEFIYIGESLSNHPIAKAICHDIDIQKYQNDVLDFVEIAGKGITCNYKNNKIILGNISLLKDHDIYVDDNEEFGTVIHLVVNNIYQGYIVLTDVIKDNAKSLIKALHKRNVEVILLTGDKDENARHISNQIGIDRYYSELLPEEKTKYLEKEKIDYPKTVAYIGDGLNDAPSIIQSDVGIAMGGIGSDIAVENADIVIMNDDPMKVDAAIKISKIARRVSIFNIIFALTVKIAVAILVTIFQDKIDMSIAVLADTGLTVLLVVNSLLILYRKIRN